MIMLDEPSEGLAPKIVADMARAIVRMKAEGLSILLSEQNLRFAKQISDRAYIIESGHMRFDGSMADLAADPEIGRKYLAV
jgi:branched-chain amino acid transport system ATP-binding protein